MVILKKTLRILLKTTLRLVLGLFLLFIGVLAALQLPQIQTYLAQKTTAYLSEKLKFPVNIEQVSIRWWDVAIFKNVSVSDLRNRKMIIIPALTIDFDIPDLLSKQGIFVEEALLEKPEVRVVVDEKTGDLNINEFVNALDDFFSSPTPKPKLKKSSNTKFAIDHIRLHDALFQYADLRQDSIKNAFDYHHISIRELNGDAYRFFVAGDTISMQVRNWRGISENPEWKINQFEVDFRQTKKNISFEALNLQVGNSTLRDSLVFNYEQQRDMGDFVNKVRIAANLKNTKIYSKDLAMFAPVLEKYNDYYQFDGNFRGYVNKFRIRNFTFRFGESSHLAGNLSMEGLPETEGMFISTELKPSLLVTEDVRQYVDNQTYPNIEKFGAVRFGGKFRGFTNDFVADGSFETALGNFQSNLKLQLRENTATSYYKGDLITDGFNLGKLIDQPEKVGLIDMNGNIEGTGLAVANANFILKAKINRIGILGYDYKNIDVNGNLSRERFKGTMNIQDPNLAFSGNGEVNMQNNLNFFDIHADLQTADLQALGFSPEIFTIKSKLNITFTGLDPDKITGQAILTDAEIVYGKDKKNVVFDSLFVRSERNKDSIVRNFDLACDFVKVQAQGNFRYEQVYKDLAEITEEYGLSLKNDRQAIRKYYEKKKKLPDNHKQYKINYQIRLTDINPLMALFLPDLQKVGKNATLAGYFQNGKNTTFSCEGSFDTLQYQDFKFYKSDFDINLSKSYSDANILGNVGIKSGKQELGKAVLTENLNIEAFWYEDRIEFDGRLKQFDNTNFAKLRGDVKFFDDRTEFKLKPAGTRIQVLDQLWRVDAENLITIRGNNIKEIHFQSVKLANNFHSLRLEGDMSEDSTKVLRLEIKDFDLSFLNPLTGMKLEGNANGYAYVQDLYKRLKVTSQVDIEEVVISRFLIGNVSGKVDWDNSLQRLTVNSAITRYEKQILTLFGTYNTQEKKNPLNISIVLDDTDLEILEPFTQGQVSGLAGKARGLLRLTGSFSEPILKGTANIRNGRFKYTYLNTVYSFSDKIYFLEDQISVKNLKLVDDNGNSAVLKGGVFHDNFKNFVIQLTAAMKNFKILNTSEKDNTMYYGTAIVSGDAGISGSIDNLLITATARSNRGTHLYIPIGGVSEVGQEDYIVFVSKKDNNKAASTKKIRKISGVKLNLNLDITPEAVCEIIFDQQTGDIIKGTGVGTLKMTVDTKGEFSMFGTFTIANGDYNFSFVGLVKKGFTVRPGGTITWNGDPYEATMNLQAAYRVNTSFAPILGNISSSTTNSTINRPYPVTVLMNLTGNLLAPKIDLDIEIREQDYPRDQLLILGVSNFLTKVKVDDAELNRQVFSLMILNRLQAEGSFSGATGSVTNSFSQLISSELNHFISQVDENLEVDFNLAGDVDANKVGNLQVRVARTFLNGRLRIERNGNFGDNPNQTQAQSIIGEWTIEYWVSEDGRWRVKMYNRNTQNALNNTLNTTNSTMAGFSLLHTTRFNNLKELFRRKKDEETQPEEPKNEEPQVRE